MGHTTGGWWRRAATWAAPVGCLLLVLALTPTGDVRADEGNGLAPAPKHFEESRTQPVMGPIRKTHAKLTGVSKSGLDDAVALGLEWLAAHQQPEGYWGVKSHAEWCDGKKLPAKDVWKTVGYEGFAVSVTSLAINAFFEAGYSPNDDHPYGAVLRKALDVLVAMIDKDGLVGKPEKTPAPDTVAARWVFDHAFASWALCRAAAMTGSYKYEIAARATLKGTELLRNPYFAWRYGIKPGDNDTAVTGVMLLGPAVAREVDRRAKAMDIFSSMEPPEGMFDGAIAWLDKVTDPDYGRVGYVQRGTSVHRYQEMHAVGYDASDSEALTAVGCQIRTWNGEDWRKSRILKYGFDLIMKRGATTSSGPVDEWHTWWASGWLRDILPPTGGARRAVMNWRAALVKDIVGRQDQRGWKGNVKGSWDPERSCWGLAGGRVYTTSLALMTLCRAGYDLAGDGSPEEVFGDRKQPVSARLQALARAGAKPKGSTSKAIRKAFSDKQVPVRIAAADAAARAGIAMKSARGTLEKRVAKEKDLTARAAQLWALHRVGQQRESLLETINPLCAHTDPAIKFLAIHARDSIQKKLPPERAALLDHRTSAHDVLLAAERAGWLHTEDRAKRAAALRWRILDENDLPATMSQRADRRIPLVPHARLVQPGVIEAIEAAFAEALWEEAALAKIWAAHEKARAAVPGQEPGAIVLRATLDLAFARRIQAEDDPQRILPQGETRRARYEHARKAVKRGRDDLEALMERVGGGEHGAERLRAQFISAYLSIANMSLFDTPTVKDALAMVKSSTELFGVMEDYTGTNAEPFLIGNLIGSMVAIGSSLEPGRNALKRRQGEMTDRLLHQAMMETTTVDGRRAVVRTSRILADALVMLQVTKYPDGDVYVHVERDRQRMPGLGRTAAEVDLLLSWVAFLRMTGNTKGAASVAKDAIAKAKALNDEARTKRAEAALK